MIDNEEIIKLIERNPSIGKQTSAADKVLINTYHIQVVGKPIASMSCSSCLLTALDKLRAYVGYNPLKIFAPKNITGQRLAICGGCEYRVEGGFLGVKDTCGNFMNKTDKTKDGVLLCGCVLSSKAKLNIKWIHKLGGCPAKKWTV